MWGFDKMSDTDKGIFNKYIKIFTDYHQEEDAKRKETANYYKMSDAEKSVFDKL